MADNAQKQRQIDRLIEAYCLQAKHVERLEQTMLNCQKAFAAGATIVELMVIIDEAIEKTPQPGTVPHYQLGKSIVYKKPNDTNKEPDNG